MLSIDNLSLHKKREQSLVTILQEITLEVPQSRITLLLGKSGSGKTSLLRCIAQLEREYFGKIHYDSKSIGKLSPKERCHLLGFVPQSYALFPHMNVLENCSHPLCTLFGHTKKDAYDRVCEVLESLDMHRLINFRPHELSGGQQQRVCIARSLVLKPSFLLFDEPTSALDPENTDLFVQIMHKLTSAGKGLLISTHDMPLASRLLDRAFYLKEGKIIESYDSKISSLSGDSKFHQLFR